MFGGLVVLFALSFFASFLFPFIQGLFVLALALVITDFALLFGRHLPLHCERRLPKLLNLGDLNTIRLIFENQTHRKLEIRVIEELPVQLQIRDFSKSFSLEKGKPEVLTYEIGPTERGAYTFGPVNVFVSGPIGLLERRIRFHKEEQSIPVFPSVLQMKEMELRAFNKLNTQKGIKRIRRLGHSYEFEQIKNYVRGDDYRSINWKASSRRAALMVNQYEDERSQQIYCVIDKSRVMHMPFEGLSLMDHAVNTSLAISNIALQKYDRAGLITFSDKIGATIKAEQRPLQLNKILNALYNESHRNVEANYEIFYYAARKLITGRSLILLFTNFQSPFALERVIPHLRKVNRLHLLVVVFFENTEIRTFAQQPATSVEGIYQKTLARKFLSEKRQMVQLLAQYGIQAILSSPQDLSINTINKYLELKSRGLI